MSREEQSTQIFSVDDLNEMKKMLHFLVKNTDKVEKQFESIERRLGNMEKRLDDVEHEIRTSRRDYSLMKEDMEQMSFARHKYGNQLGSLGTRLPGPVSSNLGQSPLFWK